MKPPFKFCGGKTRLLPVLHSYLPETCHNYWEPFVGGGALYFSYGYRCTGTAFLGDINHPLINAYQHVKDALDEVLGALTNLGETPYEGIRSQFNALKARWDSFEPGTSFWTDEDGVIFAALFIALNHLCFNGIYRENKKGEFNVPVGKDSHGVRRTLGTLKIGSLVEASQKLNKRLTNINWVPFYPYPNPFLPGKGDVWFADSPYLLEFSNYDKSGFGIDDHKRLCSMGRAIAANGATVIICGSNNSASHEIYGQPTHVVTLQRTIGNFSQSEKSRGKAEEALWVFNGRK